jgi:transposase
MWKPEHRAACDRRGLRYPSDLTDAEWALVEPLIPPAKHGGRKRTVDVREVLNAIFYVLSTGCQWPALPKDLPPKSTVHNYFMLWEWDGTLERIHHALYVAVREAEGREASPSAAVIDSQSVNSLPTVTPFSRPIATPLGVQEWACPRSAQEGPAPAAQRPRRCAERRAREAPVRPRG